MAKSITLADLNNALKPIIEAINKLREEQGSTSTQVFEMHSMVTNVSVKMDTLEQTAGATLSEVSKPVVKKATTRKSTAGRKTAAKRAPTKRGTKAAAPAADEANPAADDDAEADPAADDDAEADPAADDDAEAANDDDADPADGDDTPAPKKAAVKKAAVKKAAAPKKTAPKKAVPKKAAAAKKTTVARLNKMTIFKNAYKEDPSKFDKYLTAKVKKTIETANDKWQGKSGDALTTAQVSAYYHHMKDNHDDVLEELKAAIAAAKTNGADTNDDDLDDGDAVDDESE